MLKIDDILIIFQKKYKLKSKKNVCEFLSISPAALSMSIKRNSVGSFFETILQKIELNEFVELLIQIQDETVDISIAEKIFDKLNDFYNLSPESVSFSKKLLLTLTDEKIYFLSLLYKALEIDLLESMKPSRLHFNGAVNYVAFYLKKIKQLDTKKELQILQNFFDSLETEVLIWLLNNKKTVRLIIEASLSKPPSL